MRDCSPSRRRFLNVRIDGRRTYFEWLNAGHYTATGARGTMSMVSEGRCADFYFGFDTERLFLRFDAQRWYDSRTPGGRRHAKITFLQPSGIELLVSHPSWPEPILQLYRNDVPVTASGVEAAADMILEVAVPFRSLGVSVDAPLHFVVELLSAEQSIERLPHEGAIETFVPSADYELMMWQV